ncbi:MAG: hypothetical protein KJO25_05310, partial [Bacteroidia bacterium]|nr:hypothetical protein [Bacteroidia bacterium]
MKQKLSLRRPIRPFILLMIMLFGLQLNAAVNNRLSLNSTAINLFSEADSFDPAEALILEEDLCKAQAGSLFAEESSISTTNQVAVLSATHKAKPNVPEGFNILYVLTQGTDLVIQAVNSDPVFEVTESAIYTIHTLVYDPNTLDLNIVEFGVTTGVDVYGLIVPGGGSICADLDVAGASFKVTFNEAEECKADAGTIKADAAVVCLDGETTISATPTGDSVVPSGYSTLYVLTKGADLVIVNAGPEPSFTVTEGGNYTIHTLVYDPATLDLTIVELGVTTGVDVFGLIIPGGGDICASLDVPGAPITVEAPDAGTLTADESSVTLENGVATLSATPNGDINVPDGYSVLYVLTQGGDLVIVNAGPDPSFEVT